MVMLRNKWVFSCLFNFSINRCKRKCSGSAKNGPLSNIRVLDMTRIVAGPYCTMVLADMGAEVIKIENPIGGDETRNWGPPYVNGTKETCYFMCLNRNKKSVCVNIKNKEGSQIIRDLAKKSDVLIENYVPGQLEKFGLGYESLSSSAPELIYCSITGYGDKGPYRMRAGYDVIASSFGGLLHITGPKNGEPCKPGVALTDIATGLYAHGAILAALLHRKQSGKGQKIDCNLLSTQIASLINIGSNYLNGGLEADRWGTSHPSIVPYRSYATSDGKYITIGAGSDKMFSELCRLLEMAYMVNDERFLSNSMRVKNREYLDTMIGERLKQNTSAHWINVLKDASFPWGPVNSMQEAFEDDHVKDINLVKEIYHPIAGNVKLVGPAVEFSSTPSMVRQPPPVLGEHTTQVLSELLGYSQEQINALKENQAIC